MGEGSLNNSQLPKLPPYLLLIPSSTQHWMWSSGEGWKVGETIDHPSLLPSLLPTLNPSPFPTYNFHQRLVFWNSIHQEVASDSFCFLINYSWLLVFILYVFSLFFSGFNLYWWKGKSIHFS